MESGTLSNFTNQTFHLMRFAASALLLLMALPGLGQKKTAYISGSVVDENDHPLARASVTILGRQKGILTTDSGTFRMTVPAERAFAVVFSYSGYRDEQRNFYLSAGEEEHLTVNMQPGGTTLNPVVINNDRERTETGLVRINPNSAVTLPSATGGVEGLIKILVGSNNELTSQYSVRGGNYDENLIYINDFEIYRPYLVRNGQQEGLSFINPELARNISFYNGGFQARYGDKISSVLDIQYKKPASFAGSAYVSLLEQGFHLEGTSRNQRLTFLLGVRSKTNKDLLSSQEVKGNYVPSSADLQAYLTYRLSPKLQLEALGILSGSRFSLVPQSAQKSSAVFSPLFTADLALDIYFEGQEKDQYQTNLAGLSLVQVLSDRVKLKWMVSHFGDLENENFDITGAYLFGERNFDKSSATYGQITNPLGAGLYQDYARNHLAIDDYNISHKGTWDLGRHFVQWGLGYDRTVIRDRLNEWEYQDSAEYSLPYDPGRLVLSSVLKSNENLAVDKFNGYLQDNLRLGDSVRNITLQGGVRFNYNSLNGEFLVSPRAQASYHPEWKRDIVFRLAAGIYDQPPFYREMRRYDGTLNTALKSQKSWQVVAGFDYNIAASNKPMRITTEAYYKSLWDVDVYDIDNVRIRYYGNNNAIAYAAGIETRLYTELIKDAESWFSIGIGRTKEKIDNDYYYTYLNAEGQTITAQTPDQVVRDSAQHTVGWVRRPTDRLLTLGLFLQDYLTTNKNFKVHFSLIYGSNMPYNLPGSVKYRNALIIEPYIRADIGFSALLLSDRSLRRSHSPFRGFDNIWASLEVFNLIDRANVISYQLIKDFANDTFTIPNRLTPRLVNFKLLARF